MTGSEESDLAERLTRLEERVARLEGSDRASRAHVVGTEGGEDDPGEVFWALRALKERVGDAVLFTGSVTLPDGEHYEWQQGHASSELVADDWSQAADALSALAHPVRLMLLREILCGAHGTAELAADERLGTTGQLYHHLRQLVAAGWLRTTARGRYAVPGERVVPILTILAATRR
ncbi:transcriptional regulator [Actinomadura sp. NBRC 104412]|uniref:ArsR/SmtB family transcription factor n=1 Tax=Actinomadura sp. NBRC 104412 TaxID=3032203 RepID=UPI0024A1FAE1|nr:helix-turn-helix domain-containing protein [Actinomadura sp. NBRC 104412]GLZ03797.1 transcriptional regulator [Actinomadura sp. NBRC 104412]